VVVAGGFALRITAALNDRGVANISNISSNYSNVGRVRVHASVYERHLRKDQRERIMGWDESAMLRAGVMGISRRNMWRVGGTSFWCHRDKRKKNRTTGNGKNH
jgi:hypothetical protein